MQQMDAQEMASPSSDGSFITDAEAGGEVPIEQLARIEELPFEIPRD